MHWSLLREMVHNELGDDPENIFAGFDKRAFAAASLGQVHRARLKTGEEVAVKIQYPGIGRAVREDFRNLGTFLLPARLSKDWEVTKDQYEDLRTRLEQETDYELEASNLQKVRPLFHEDDGILVPRVYTSFSTSRVLTMERLGGVHLDAYLSRNPTQAERNEFGRKLCRAWHRMMYSGRLLYLDCHPGNFLFLDDGRLGVIDFGNVAQIPDDLWAVYHKIDRAIVTGRRDDRLEVVKDWGVTDDPSEADRLRVAEEMVNWNLQPLWCDGEFDYADEAFFRRGVDLVAEGTRKRYTRGRSISPWVIRQQFGFYSLLYRLKAKFDVRAIAEEEVKATGWDRSDYVT